MKTFRINYIASSTYTIRKLLFSFWCSLCNRHDLFVHTAPTAVHSYLLHLQSPLFKR